MGIWFIVFIVAVVDIALFLLYIYFLKKHPVLYMPFDYQYRVFKRAYRAYKPVREGKKLYSVFADDFLFAYKRSLEKKDSSEEFTVANRVCRVDVSNADKARFIRNLLEVEPNTKEIANTNTYKILKTNNKELLVKGEIKARIKDYTYIVGQLKYLGLEKERTLILNEINELRNSIDE